ncbi:polyribonucleotide nucleotidyltransferase [Thalassospira tepidiphila]|uniref:Polyribonucleotide nucleotidyltransferase n=1 Tax=Thalassospira indica TaxID=1891279 RepID=A0ABM6XYC9_9PROT|nr:polyribonucleotide nucleotidyltransferase [Thalassospira indica]AXO12995.1 polyribonucleotide nucleotidyltransferase [Thalassospira indica]OAZ15159.1 polynucleotide phosphorylase/polyadenylase [Thalassospira profundimaris]BDW91079.1 polyribonucleotide nucleotidyltransferase [Thalassospira tepidiphila]BDW98167.1 polyribonucleotide nucleotidyltransferase [Thalassospira tepidiphila]
MFNVVRKEMQWGNAKLVLETGKIARQADGAVKVTYGETVVLCTAVGAKQPRPDVDFFPLTVNYQEKAFAAGKIPGGFFKREGRPSEKETLVSRLIDRPIRPLFHPQYRNDTQIVCTVLSHDMENDPDVVAMIGTSAALTISGLPFLGPIGAARVGYKDGEYLLNPSTEAVKESDLDLVVAGTRDGVMMVESEASELSEEIMLGAVKFGHEQFQGVLDLIIDLAEEAAKEPRDVAELPEGYDALVEKIAALGTESLTAAYAHVVKQERSAAVSAAKADIVEKLGDEVPDALKGKVSSIIKDLEKDIVRGAILKTGKRIDGRTGADVRPIMGEVSVLPRSHGSSIFTRGETQALAVVTLGTGQDEQIVDALDGEYRESFMLHYNFPPYSVGEAGRMGSPGRREIGHGKLAWRALHPLMPGKDAFPYTTRIVSEVTESNGSSSMATVCASSLAMMDAGVPLARPVAGIAMGLIKEAEDFAVLSDIMGDEDHLGDMDFKVAGTENGITSLQMDIKITSVTPDIMQIALKQARDGRLHILGEMAKALPEARGEVSGNAPTITQFSIPKDKIRDVIGSGGKVIREICEETGAKVDIEDDGSITVAHTDGAKGKQAVDWIKSIVAEPELNHIYDGKVVKAVDFGAFVNFFGARDGLVHISELAPERVKQVSDIVKEGDQVKVKVIGFDDRGKIKLSMKRVDQETGADLDAGDAE